MKNKSYSPLKNRYVWIVLICIVLLVGIPSLIGLFMTNYQDIKIFKFVEGDWLSFWGSYLGATLTVLGAYFISRIELNSNLKQHRQEQVQAERPFFNILPKGAKFQIEFYNQSHSVLSDVSVSTKQEDQSTQEIKFKKEDFRYLEAGKIVSFTIDKYHFINSYIVTAKTLSQEDILFFHISKKDNPLEIPLLDKYFVSNLQAPLLNGYNEYKDHDQIYNLWASFYSEGTQRATDELLAN